MLIPKTLNNIPPAAAKKHSNTQQATAARTAVSRLRAGVSRQVIAKNTGKETIGSTTKKMADKAIIPNLKSSDVMFSRRERGVHSNSYAAILHSGYSKNHRNRGEVESFVFLIWGALCRKKGTNRSFAFRPVLQVTRNRRSNKEKAQVPL
jgi:hypothetical protein